MKPKYAHEFFFSAAALLITIIVIHALFVTVVRPRAAAIVAEQNAKMRSDINFIPQRSLYVVIKDYEQESEIILMIWALAILVYKSRTALRERRILDTEFVRIPEGVKILPEDTREYSRQIEALPADSQALLLPRALLAALGRFAATRHVQDVATASHSVCATEADRLDSELSMLRYIAWAIPAIGFIGTVRGIGDALAEAHKAVSGDISGVTAGLGVAFNSTLIALLLSILLMFFMHGLQRAQERLVLDAETFLDQRLIRHMQSS
jgi:biopolymer transport protein ExbB/TolQ